MTRHLFLAAAGSLALAIAALPIHAVAAIPRVITAAVDDAARPQTDRARDANRKPAQVLAFAGIKPGERVAELIPASGYYTRILSRIVGPTGHVYALSPPPRGGHDMGAAVKKIAADPHYSNVSPGIFTMSGLQLPGPVDVVWTSDNYHDLHNISGDVAAFDRAVFKALKPGGIFIVLDHAAAPGTGFTKTHTLHRADPEAVRKEVLSAGFRLVARSSVLHNPADPHNVPIFDPSIRGKTDQFLFKFRKP